MMVSHRLYVPPQNENGAIIRVHDTEHLSAGALFSRDEQYRYALWRVWGRRDDVQNRRTFCVVGLNPSTADERTNDPTVERCMRRADQYGYDALLMLNLFAFRATDPRAMKEQGEPEGPWNDSTLEWAMDAVSPVTTMLVAWGAHGAHLGASARFVREAYVRKRELFCLGTTKGGEPAHPLYLSYDRQPTPYTGRR